MALEHFKKTNSVSDFLELLIFLSDKHILTAKKTYQN